MNKRLASLMVLLTLTLVAYAAPKMRLVDNRNNDRVARIDSSTHSIQQISYEHHEIHSGNHYFYEDTSTLASAATVEFGIQTPDSAKWTHLVWQLQAQGLMTFEVFEVATITFDGVGQTAYNSDRNSTNLSNWAQFERDPTVLTNGTRMSVATVGDASNPVSGIPGGGMRDREIILKQNTVYLFKITSGVNDNTITYRAEWYEHTNVE